MKLTAVEMTLENDGNVSKINLDAWLRSILLIYYRVWWTTGQLPGEPANTYVELHYSDILREEFNSLFGLISCFYRQKSLL